MKSIPVVAGMLSDEIHPYCQRHPVRRFQMIVTREAVR